MADPITWRNVNATVRGSEGGRGSGYFGAQKSFDSGFEALRNVLQDRQAINQDNFQTRQSNTAADYLDRVAQAQSLDQLNALRGSGELAQLRGNLTGEFRNQIRGALDKRETGLIEQIGQRQGFQDEQWLRDNQDVLAAAEQQAIGGDLNGALRAIREAGGQGVVERLRGARDSFNTSDDQRIQQGQFQLAKNRDGRDAELHGTRMHDWREQEAIEDRTAAINAAVVRAAQNDPAGTTLSRQELIKDLQQQFPEAPSSTWSDLRTNWDVLTEGRYGLSAGDTRQIDMADQADALDMGMDNNVFYNATQEAPNAVVAELMDKHSQEGRYFAEEGNDDKAEDARNHLIMRAAEGIDVDGRTVPIPKVILDTALSNAKDNWTEWDTDFDEALRDLLTSDTFKTQADKYAQYEDRRALRRFKEEVRLSGRPN